MKEICCKTETGPKLLCAEGRCLYRKCGFTVYRNALVSGKGCHTFKGNMDFDVEFKRIVQTEIDDKKHKYVVHDSLPWKEFIDHFCVTLKTYLKHSFFRRRQHVRGTKYVKKWWKDYVARKLCLVINGSNC